MSTPYTGNKKMHPHRDLIIAWANGAEIQVMLAWSKGWVDADTPGWDENSIYRIKPKKPEIQVDHHLMYLNLRFTVEKDGALMKFTDVELIK